MVSGSPVMMAEVEALIRRNSAMNIELFGRVNSDDIDLHLRHAAHTVLEHVLRSDRLWLSRITGRGSEVDVAYRDLPSLWEARKDEDARIENVLLLGLGDVNTLIAYESARKQCIEPVIVCVFRMINHQVNHQWKLEVACKRGRAGRITDNDLLRDVQRCLHLL